VRIVGPRGRSIRRVAIEFDADDRDESLRKLAARVQRFLDGDEPELSIGFAADPPVGRLARLDDRISEWLWRRRRSPAAIVVRRR
jgi:hypothetical protein